MKFPYFYRFNNIDYIIAMEYNLFDVLTLIGSLGLFLYGMKLMSEALQKVAGDKMRNILSAICPGQ